MSKVHILGACSPVSPKCVLEILKGGRLPKHGTDWEVGNDLRPSDLYCYLYARFGPPSGIQNLLRGDHSNNLIHWEWCLGHRNGLVFIQGMNYRTEVHLVGDWADTFYGPEEFTAEVKGDLAAYGARLKEVRMKVLEDWTMFTNPYRTLRAAIANLKGELDSLCLNPESEQLANPTSVDELKEFQESYSALTERYNHGIGLSLALRFMMPVLAETFVNLVLFILCRPDVKRSKRLYEAAIRENMDVKVQSLHMRCLGFSSPVDWSSRACAEYSKIVNERNDLLHGNLTIEKLKYGEIYFNGNVPVFKQYETVWQQSLGVSLAAAGVNKVKTDLAAVEGFIEYALSCLEQGVREELVKILEKRDLGQNKNTGRLGVLLPDYMIDFRMKMGPA